MRSSPLSHCQTMTSTLDWTGRTGPDSPIQDWTNILLYNLRGHRFIGSGLGPRTNGLKIECYGDVGDYVASGIDGCEITVHGAAQDQAAQILKYGKLVVHGDV